MKKIVFPVALIAASLVFFSFKPMNKSIGINEKKNMTNVVVPVCDKFNETLKDFTKCYTVSSGSTLHAANTALKADILSKY